MLPPKLKDNVHKSYVKPAEQYESEALCLKVRLGSYKERRDPW